MKGRTQSYIISSVAMTLTLLFLTVLLLTKPAQPPAEYWIELAVLGVACFFALLSFPFMKSVANVKALPENMAGPIMAIVLLLFAVLLIDVLLGALPQGDLSTALLAGLLLLGIINIVRDMLAKDKKKRLRIRSKAASCGARGDADGHRTGKGAGTSS